MLVFHHSKYISAIKLILFDNRHCVPRVLSCTCVTALRVGGEDVIPVLFSLFCTATYYSSPL